MKTTPPADDYGLQKRRQANTHHEVKETKQVSAYPRIESDEERHEPKRPVVSERRKQRRRKRGRRLIKFSSLIDTRDIHERRLALRREEKEAAATPNDTSAAHGNDNSA